MQNASSLEPSLLAAILKARRLYGANRTIARDATGASLTYRTLFLRAFALSRPIAKATAQEATVAVLLPTALAPVVTFLALHMQGKTPAMLNCSAGLTNIRHACTIAQARTILTSRTFGKLAGLEELLASLEAEFQVIYLEDVRERLSLADKLGALAKSFFPACALSQVLSSAQPEDVAVVLYTSGSEGAPKGVALSHKNILTNIEQARAQLDLTCKERLFNPLPVFHSFGLNVGVLLPLTLGIPTFLYPSPLHYKQIPPLVREFGATIFVGTDTFYQGYARTAAPEDFSTVRLAVAGAEKLKEATFMLWKERFGLTLLQGYGITETSPVLSVNTPEDNRPGTVGRALYSIATRIEPVEGVTRGGRLWVMGDNVMLGYLKADQPGVIQPQGDWYDTGDIVDIDADGFIHILGRAKRFAKVGGEMISLLAVEELAQNVAPEQAHAAIALADKKKGEQIVLFTECASLTREDMLRSAQALGVSELHLPRKVVTLEALPRLGNGKIDYIGLAAL
jgi:acyl-[acyl-carrier-protein]-phospholipid O-acyltransferase/long-chain-fatty-acid--[acyl-carrier-protein] ligase